MSSDYSHLLAMPISDQRDETMGASGIDASGSESENDHTDESHGQGSSRKRKRGLKISCETCKARKVKCDRAEPACGWCARNNRPCVYLERKKPGGLRLAYGRELEDKINRLEAVLHSLGRRVEEHISEHDITSHPRNPQNFSPRTQHAHHFHQPPDIRQPMVSASYNGVSVSATTMDTPSQSTPAPRSTWSGSSYGRETYSRPPETMSVYSVVDTPQEQKQQPKTDRMLPALSTYSPQEQLYAPSNEDIPRQTISYGSDLPPHDLLYSLVDLFFKHVNPWSPILDRKSTVDSFFRGKELSGSDQILLHAIVATTLRFSQDARLSPEVKAHYVNLAKEKVQLYGMEHPSIPALQALVILAVDILGTSNGLQGWNLLALITRNVVQLGLGEERSVYLGSPAYSSISSRSVFTQSPPQSWIQEEERRRLVWMVYILDRYATVATASAFTFSDREMNRRLPCRYDLFSKNEPVETRWPRGHLINSSSSYPSSSSHNDPHATSSSSSPDKPENLGSFSYHCEVLTILSRVHNFLKQPLDYNSLSAVQTWRDTYQALDGELNTWLQSLPGEYGKISQLCHSDPGSKISNWIMLHAAFVTAVIRLHSAAAYPTVRSQIFTASYNAMQRCLGAAESLREIAQDTLNTSMLDLLGPQFAFSLWTSARLLLVHAATMECHVDPKVRFFIATLKQMGQHWEVARTYSETLGRVVDEHEASHGQKSFKSMRKAAYNLTIELSRHTRSALEPSSVRVPTQNELEYLDIFDFFNYPHSIISTGRTDSDSSPSVARSDSWSQDRRDASNTNDRSSEEYRSLSRRPDSGVDIHDASDRDRVVMRGSLTPTFAMPSRESDWLNFQPPQE